MSKNEKNTRFTFNQKLSEEPLQKADWCKAEDLLARLIAQAYAEDNPEFFAIDIGNTETEQNNNSRINGDNHEKTNSSAGNEESEAA